jgi:hypothetical protein
MKKKYLEYEIKEEISSGDYGTQTDEDHAFVTTKLKSQRRPAPTPGLMSFHGPMSLN